MFVRFTKQHFQPLCNPARSRCLEAIFPTALRALQNMELAGDCVTALTALENTNSCSLQLSSHSQSSTSLFNGCAASPDQHPAVSITQLHHWGETGSKHRPFTLEIVKTQRMLCKLCHFQSYLYR